MAENLNQGKDDQNEEEYNYFCGCIGYAFVPIQQLEQVLSADEALDNGSLFPELILSIDEYGKVCKQRGGNV